MTESAAIDLDSLIAVVDARHPPDALAAIVAATQVAAELADLSDRLIGYFVERARVEGRSWSDIGALMGVSRQAAQQRFGARLAMLGLAELERAGGLGRWTARARDAIVRAEANARRLDHPDLGVGHLLIALLEDEESLSARAVARAGATPSKVRSLLERGMSTGTGSPGIIPIAPETRRAMANATEEALGLGHNYIGTEHLVLGAARLTDTREADLLSSCGVDYAQLRPAVVELIDDYLRAHD